MSFPEGETADNKKRKADRGVLPTLTSPYYVLLQGIEAVANEKGYGVFICNNKRDARSEEKYLRMIRTMQAALGESSTCNRIRIFRTGSKNWPDEIPSCYYQQ